MLGLSAFSAVPFSAVGGVVWYRSVDELVSGAEAVSASVVFQSSVSEQASGASTIHASFAFLGRVFEDVTAADSVVSIAQFNGFVSESASGSVFISPANTMNVSVAEYVVASDNVIAQSIIPVSVFNSVVISDAIVGRKLWDVIDTYQLGEAESSFTKIGTFAGFSMSGLPFAGSPETASIAQGWQNVQAPPNTTWTTEDTSEANDWEPIKTL